MLIYCLMYFPLFMGVPCFSFFCYALLCVHLSFAMILKRKRKLVALLLLSYICIFTINDMWLFLTVPWVRLQCVIVVFADHTHLFFYTDITPAHNLGLTQNSIKNKSRGLPSAHIPNGILLASHTKANQPPLSTSAP